jgi:hypothetical protein
MTRQNSTYPPPPPPPIKIGLTPPLTWVGTNDFYKMYCKRYSLRNLFPSVQSCPMRRHIGDVGFRGRPLERCGGVDFQLGIFLRNFKGIFLCFPLARSFFFCFLCANRNPPRPLRFWIPCKVRFCHMPYQQKKTQKYQTLNYIWRWTFTDTYSVFWMRSYERQ